MELFSRHYRRLIALSLLLTLCVVALGSYTRLSDAGLGCPDWPGCYGELWAPAAVDDASHAEFSADRPYDPAAARIEMAHRLLAGILGLALIGLAVGGWRSRLCRPHWAMALLGLLACQVVLGMLTVTWLLKPIVVSAHLFFAFALAMVLWMIHADDRCRRPLGGGILVDGGNFRPGPRLSRLSLALVAAVAAVLLAQIFLGVWMSSHYASLACTGFPRCNGQWLPSMDFAAGFSLWQGLGVDYEFGVLDSDARVAIHWSHRLNALILVAVLIAALLSFWGKASAPARRSALVFAALLGAQIVLGIANVLAGLPIANAVAHTVMALVLVLGWLECALRLLPARTSPASQ